MSGNLADEMKRLERMRSDGEVSEEEFASRKDELVNTAVARMDAAWPKVQRAQLRKIRPSAISGRVEAVESIIERGKQVYILSVGTKFVRIYGPDQVPFAVGDYIVASGPAFDAHINAAVVRNLTSGATNLPTMQKAARIFGRAVIIFFSAAVALLVVLIDALRSHSWIHSPAFQLWRIPFYIADVLVIALTLYICVFFVCAWVTTSDAVGQVERHDDKNVVELG